MQTSGRYRRADRTRMDGNTNWGYVQGMKLFRTIAYAEGVSFLVLLGIAMPLKYVWGMPQAVKTVGMLHGVLFVAYVGILAHVASDNEWSLKKSALGFIAAVLPFGPFLFQHSIEKPAH